MTDGAKHEQAYAVADGCPYCEVVAAAEPDPWERIRALQNMASDKWPTMPFVGGMQQASRLARWQQVQGMVDAGMLSVLDAMRALSGDDSD